MFLCQGVVFVVYLSLHIRSALSFLLAHRSSLDKVTYFLTAFRGNGYVGQTSSFGLCVNGISIRGKAFKEDQAIIVVMPG